MELSTYQIAVLIPCYNEGLTVGQVIQDFKKSLPTAKIYVYDNNSTDNTIISAIAEGAIIGTEPLQGKGNVVRRMFADVDADIYVLVDGDATYDAASAPAMINTMIENSLDMINAARRSVSKEAYRKGHTFGNKLLSGITKKVFGKQFNDMLSGYKIFSRRFVKSFPVSSLKFEIETELTIHALELNIPSKEFETPYFARPEGSFSKLATYKDGFRILSMIFKLIQKERPLFFFSICSGIFCLLALLLAFPILITYAQTGLVPRLPTAILSAGLVILSFLSLTCGLILDTVTHGRKEAKRMQYLNFQPLKLFADNRGNIKSPTSVKNEVYTPSDISS